MGVREGSLDARPSFSEASKPWSLEVEGEYPNKYKGKSIRTDRWKYVLTPVLGRKELFDLAADPAELRNVFGRENKEAERLERALIEWVKVTEPGFEAGDLTINEEVRERLRALGYF